MDENKQNNIQMASIDALPQTSNVQPQVINAQSTTQDTSSGLNYNHEDLFVGMSSKDTANKVKTPLGIYAFQVLLTLGIIMAVVFGSFDLKGIVYVAVLTVVLIGLFLRSDLARKFLLVVMALYILVIAMVLIGLVVNLNRIDDLDRTTASKLYAMDRTNWSPEQSAKVDNFINNTMPEMSAKARNTTHKALVINSVGLGIYACLAIYLTRPKVRAYFNGDKSLL